jgi:hypothetical protein
MRLRTSPRLVSLLIVLTGVAAASQSPRFIAHLNRICNLTSEFQEHGDRPRILTLVLLGSAFGCVAVGYFIDKLRFHAVAKVTLWVCVIAVVAAFIPLINVLVISCTSYWLSIPLALMAATAVRAAVSPPPRRAVLDAAIGTYGALAFLYGSLLWDKYMTLSLAGFDP